MKKPKAGALIKNKNNYWDKIDKMRTSNGLPKWCFDFIGLHKCYWDSNCYTFSSPMLINNALPDNGRPDFETDIYVGKSNAINAAKGIAKFYSTFVVLCYIEGNES